jgi:CDP-diacylglycerol--serine O-phosphatidyltransferase
MKILQAIRNNIPNAITCMNLLSGSLACIAAFSAFDEVAFGLQGYQVAYILIGMAAVFDFFDGFVARSASHRLIDRQGA